MSGEKYKYRCWIVWFACFGLIRVGLADREHTSPRANPGSSSAGAVSSAPVVADWQKNYRKVEEALSGAGTGRVTVLLQQEEQSEQPKKVEVAASSLRERFHMIYAYRFLLTKQCGNSPEAKKLWEGLLDPLAEKLSAMAKNTSDDSASLSINEKWLRGHLKILKTFFDEKKKKKNNIDDNDMNEAIATLQKLFEVDNKSEMPPRDSKWENAYAALDELGKQSDVCVIDRSKANSPSTATGPGDSDSPSTALTPGGVRGQGEQDTGLPPFAPYQALPRYGGGSGGSPFLGGGNQNQGQPSGGSSSPSGGGAPSFSMPPINFGNRGGGRPYPPYPPPFPNNYGQMPPGMFRNPFFQPSQSVMRPPLPPPFPSLLADLWRNRQRLFIPPVIESKGIDGLAFLALKNRLAMLGWPYGGRYPFGGAPGQWPNYGVGPYGYGVPNYGLNSPIFTRNINNVAVGTQVPPVFGTFRSPILGFDQRKVPRTNVFANAVVRNPAMLSVGRPRAVR